MSHLPEPSLPHLSLPEGQENKEHFAHPSVLERPSRLQASNSYHLEMMTQMLLLSQGPRAKFG